jgi:S-adenosylmethionine:tRNA ribosyltransferase-isomerase
MPAVRTDDFDYELPEELIAQQALPRGTSRLMVVDRRTGTIDHRVVADLPELLAPDDVLLLNDTRVLAARVEARRPTGRRFELLMLRPLNENHWEALLRPSARARPGERLELPDGGGVWPETSLGEGIWRVRCDPVLDSDRLDRIGSTPLPPYIARPDGPSAADRDRYQTVYAAVPGAVAAPTAGLHLTDELLASIRGRGVDLVFTTLHVGIGTFRPVSVDRIEDHRMHAEWFCFDSTAARQLDSARAAERRIVCVGTTSVRALEGALTDGNGRLEAGDRWTEIFITPGYRFQATGAMLTNFHLPRSTLLMMVSAFAGRELMLEAYRQAVEARYRFFSYGDAMLIV